MESTHMHAKNFPEGGKQLGAHPSHALRDVHQKANEAWPEVVGEYEDEYPETPWFSLGAGDFEMVVESTDRYNVRLFAGHRLVATDCIETLWAALVRVMAAQGFSLRGV
ncbi:hypothetical protein QCE62_00335 [Caballeronia sp. LZ033]|uniref:hypothetical protein n=1 Tax=Caballeronia sp. LZ033 TaxID=3038566 RepID=UPI002854B95B|nr:hypothetical protein [Caballeronia sp. LZ033]MDR5812035.1 hypothetical protein [Caballeronia sp. LZ033]